MKFMLIPQYKESKNGSILGIYILGYLGIAKISLTKLKDAKYLGKSIMKNKHHRTYPSGNKGLWIAIIFNLKHAIELIIKFYGIEIDRHYLQIHDINYLLEDLEEKLVVENKREVLNRLKSIVEKYYKNEIFADIKLVNTVDKQNDIFRYADNSERIILDTDLFDRVSKKDIELIENDIVFLRGLFFKRKNKVDFVPSIKRWGKQKTNLCS